MRAAPAFIADLALTRRAYEYAVELHRGQRRASDLAPFILHPLEVAVLLYHRGFADHVVAAGLLHDAIEDTAATPEDLEGRFGRRVADLVQALSDDPSIEDRRARKRELREQVRRAGDEARAVFAADKVVKARELRATVTRDRAAVRDPDVRLRLEHYEESLRMLETASPALPLVGQLRFELWALHELPPQT